MPDIIELPSTLRIGDRTDPYLSFRSRSGGVALSGVEQVIAPLSAVWKWRVVLPLRGKAGVLAARTMRSQLKGRFNWLRARVCDRYRLFATGDPMSHSDGTFFSDGTGYAVPQPSAEISADTARGTSVIAFVAASAGMSEGMFFSIDDWLYQITGIDDDGNVTIAPPLRTDVMAGDLAEFDARSLWTLDTDDAGSFELRASGSGTMELALTEAIGRALE